MFTAKFTRLVVRAKRAAGLGVAATLASLLLVLFSTPASAVVDDFTDVPIDHKFRTEITWLADQQITTGYADGTFKPRASVTREAFAAFLYRLAGKPQISLPTKSPFKDVPKSAQFYKEIVWLSNQGITNGWSDGTFRPKAKISREAVAAFLYRFEGRPSFTPPAKSPFTDVTRSSQFYKEVTWLARSGITTGYADGTFKPKNSVSREAIAAFLHRGNTVAQRNGTYKVGSAIKPGIYTATIAGDWFWPSCYWERRNASGNTFEGIIANDFHSYGRAIVEIKASDKYFHTNGCSGWTPLRKVSPTATSLGDGVHAVGYHMRAGTYRAYGGEGCYWEQLRNFSGSFDAIIDNQYINGRPADVRLTAGQGFKTEDCGVWRRVGN